MQDNTDHEIIFDLGRRLGSACGVIIGLCVIILVISNLHDIVIENSINKDKECISKIDNFKFTGNAENDADRMFIIYSNIDNVTFDPTTYEFIIKFRNLMYLYKKEYGNETYNKYVKQRHDAIINKC